MLDIPLKAVHEGSQPHYVCRDSFWMLAAAGWLQHLDIVRSATHKVKPATIRPVSSVRATVGCKWHGARIHTPQRLGRRAEKLGRNGFPLRSAVKVRVKLR